MLIRNINEERHDPVAMDGVDGVKMAVMVGREDGAPHFALRAFDVQPGGHSPHHSHDYEHEVYVVSGGGTVMIDGDTRSIREGDVIFVPADLEHQFRAGDAGLRFLCMVPVDRACGDPVPGS